jgi:hypothetical protein
MIRLLVTAWCGLIVAGCALRVPQVDSAFNWFQAYRVLEPKDSDPDHSKWLASVGGYGAVLTPYAAEGLIVFASNDGSAISFDGWVVRSIIGFGRTSPISIEDRGSNRIVISDGRQRVINCDSWVRTELQWLKTCDHGVSRIDLDDAGNIISINIPLGHELGAVKLHIFE